jgi:hypothetical protein
VRGDSLSSCWSRSKRAMSAFNNNTTTFKHHDLTRYASPPQTKHTPSAPDVSLHAQVVYRAVHRRSEEEKDLASSATTAVLTRHGHPLVVRRRAPLVPRAVYRIVIVVHAFIPDPIFMLIGCLLAELSQCRRRRHARLRPPRRRPPSKHTLVATPSRPR